MSDRIGRLIERAEHLYGLGQVDGAIDVLREALSDEPDLAEAHAWLAACLIRKRRVYAATVEADMALQLEPALLLGHWVAAEVALARRDFESAGRHIDLLLEAAPEEAAFYRLRARWLELTGRGRERLAVLEEGLERDPENAATLAALAEFHAETGDNDSARRYARDALRYAPESTDALVSMGRVLLAQGSAEEAREHALAALRSDPEHPGALGLLTAVKARSSFWLGLWWRYASWGERVGPTKNIIVLLAAFVCYRVAVIATTDAGATAVATAVQITWLAIVVYSFAGPAIFHKALRKELDSVRLQRF